MTANLSKRRFSLTNVAVIAVFVVIMLTVFLTQSGGGGFWDFYHGGVSAHGLAIMSRATPENGFVGHAITYIERDGSINLFYFDRYPFFFSVFMHTIMSVTGDLGAKVFLARQVMNSIFVLTILFAYLLMQRLTRNALLALGVVILSVSSASLNYYRDMVHYDQPALLGMFILLVAITIHKQENKHRWRWLYVATIIAVSLGRGYASFFVAGVWFLIEAGGLLLNRKLSVGQRIKAILSHDATRVMVIGVLWAGAFLSYNIISEAMQRGVPIEDTSVVGSALRRLPREADDGPNAPIPIPPLPEFTAITFERLLIWFVPGQYPVSVPNHQPVSIKDVSPVSIILSALALVIVTVFVVRQPPTQRILLAIIAYSGLVWVFFMMNLTYVHDYTAMYGLGFALVFYLAVTNWLQRYRAAAALLLILALAAFIATNVQDALADGDRKREYDVFTEDYNHILRAIGTDQVVYDTFYDRCTAFKLRCYQYLRGFYLGDNSVARYNPEYADYIINAHTYYVDKDWVEPGTNDRIQLLAQSLTPDNQFMHVFAVTSAETRQLPDDVSDLYFFGGSFALQKWELRDRVEVQPCQRIHLESWWRVGAILPDDYSLQIAMVNTSGESIAASNRSLSQTFTSWWQADRYYFDRAQLRIPCDAAPGEYPLVMSIYDPVTVFETGSLPVTLSDGTPFNDYVYLTTLFIR